MTTASEVKELKAELRALKAQLGMQDDAPSGEVEDRADFIPHGSDEHAAFLGLVPVDPGNDDHELTYTSPGTGKVYALEDDVMQFVHFPDPAQAARLTLRQKVNVLETKPEIPEGAPPVWRPIDVPV